MAIPRNFGGTTQSLKPGNLNAEVYDEDYDEDEADGAYATSNF